MATLRIRSAAGLLVLLSVSLTMTQCLRAQNATAGSDATSITLALSTKGAPVPYGTSVTMTAAVSCPNNSGSPYGTIQFFYGGKIMTGVHMQNGQAELSYDKLPGGSNLITAKYLGSSDCKATESAPVTQVVEPAATATTALNTAPNPSVAGQKVAMIASVTSGSGKPFGAVQFFDGAKLIAGANLNGSGNAMLDYGGFTAGTHTITAKYLGNADYSSSASPPITQEVKP
jgi:hypothetical protein